MLFDIIEIEKINMTEYNAFPSKSIYTTIPWIKFLADLNNAHPLIIRIQVNDTLVGYFSGLLVRKCGLMLCGSPLPGWTTSFMGFDVHDTKMIPIILPELVRFIFTSTKCVFFECTERNIKIDCFKDTIIHYASELKNVRTLEIDLLPSLEHIFASLKSDCRQFIRQFEKKGAEIEIAEPNEIFAQELYSQIQDVFAKQKLVPTYSLHKITTLLAHLNSTGLMLCLRVKNPEGVSIASYISIGYNNKFYGWCIGSLKEFQYYRPNEYLIWYAIKYWREKGFTKFDFIGEREYKNKWNPTTEDYSNIIISKYRILISLRKFAKKIYKFIQKRRGSISSKKRGGLGK